MSKIQIELINALADFMIGINLESISLSKAEMIALFGIATREAKWSMKGGYIVGRDEENNIFIPPVVLLSEGSEENTWHPHAEIAALFQLYIKKLGVNELIDTLVRNINEEFEYISEGQVRALIKRTLAMSLLAGERNQLSRLRKRMEGYRKLLDAFEGKIDRSSPGKKVIKYEYENPLKKIDRDTWLENMQKSLKFICWKCKEVKSTPYEIINFPECKNDGKTMRLSWNVNSSKSSLNESIAVLEKGINPLKKIGSPRNAMGSIDDKQIPKLYCTVCSTYMDIPEELQDELENSEWDVELPQHHGKMMQIEIVRMESGEFQSAIEFFKKLRQIDAEAGLYFACKECDYYISHNDVEKDENGAALPLEHHGKKMTTISFSKNPKI